MLVFLLVALLGQTVTCASQQIQTLSRSSSDFSQRLYQQLTESTLVYSPYSIHSAFTMTSYGARGDTASEMTQTLGLTSLTGSTSHRAYHDLIAEMNSVQGVDLNTANAIYVNPAYPINDDFVREVKTDYFSIAEHFDLAAPAGPEKAINDFIETKTEHMIKDLLQPGTIDGNTFMLLINTIFFNGTWLTPFESFNTKKRDFYKLNGTTSQMDMMRDGGKDVKYKKDDVNGVDVVELQFKNTRFSLFIALPQTKTGITDLEKYIATPGNVDQLFSGLVPDIADVILPKFKIETSINLKDPLVKMGMVKAFDRIAADFSGITPTGVYISQALHKAVIEVTETGTVASAATVISMVGKGIVIGPVQTFLADHPFLFFLRDNKYQHILFQGKFSG